ncbi:methyl-CpG-binding domain-containing protein 2 isoform X2 [Magnolia sinica]|nr:methyl-CpG-binding domain-containing protein 2 isoform X2 [Magnolia sinica]
MQSQLQHTLPEVKKEHDVSNDSRSQRHSNKTYQDLANSTWDKAQGSSENEDSASLEEQDQDAQSSEDAPNQLVVYNPGANDSCDSGQIQPVLDPHDYQPPIPKFVESNAPRVLPSVGAFTVQCAACFKWRLIPTKEKYEEIREYILEVPFVCETAREWRPDISCDDPADISQDGSRLWAIDKPSISQPPPGWQRLLRIRGEGSTRFADVYYATPSGKRLRSMVEIQKYLLEHPEYVRAGVNISQFSFQIPKPLQENYVRKRPHTKAMQQYDGPALEMPRPFEPSEANPLSWAGPVQCSDMQIADRPRELPAPCLDAPDDIRALPPPPKKQATRQSPKKMYSNPVYNQPRIKVEEPQQARNATAFEL